MIDTIDGRSRVLHLTDAGRTLNKKILGGFTARERDMLACLDTAERQALLRILEKIIKNGQAWAKPY